MTLGAFALAFIAGVLSILSPCVLPIVPIVLGAAVSEHRWGPTALAVGLAVSFVVIGLFAATIGYSIGLDADRIRYFAAGLMIALGIILLVPRFQTQLALAGAPLANWSDRHLSGAPKSGIIGQVTVGLLLGAVWSPCVGPTLGAASLLAAQGRDLGEVGATMLAFGLGAALPLATLGLLSREAVLRWRTRLMAGGARAKVAFAIVLVAIGVLVLTGRPNCNSGRSSKLSRWTHKARRAAAAAWRGRHLAAYGNTNMYRPVNNIKKKGGNGE